ncbi:hypothetical protein [Streptomyces sp. NPDC021224]|uniref:hypothetical protein n=1 Tax=unclassified Streptomyces TaxID=2593676 RepID=UPI0037982E85
MTAVPDAHDDDTPEAMDHRHHRTPDDPDRAPASPSAPAPASDAAADAGSGTGAFREADRRAAGEEEALRVLFHQAVRDLRPAPDALEHLRHAVPARRQHRRQAMAGSVAALLLVGAAVPALVHAAGATGGPSAAPAGPGSPRASQPDDNGRADAWGTSGDAGADRTGPGDGDSGRQTSASGGDGNSAGPVTSPGGLPTPAAPACSSAQLGRGSSSAVPDSDGHIHGWFRVANVSTSTCTVPPGPATVGAIAQGAADPAQITVVNHTAGDAATELPPPADDGQPLVLAPGQTYEVAFAWVPADTGPGGCPPTGSPTASPTATPTPTDTGGPAAADGKDGAGSAAAVKSDGPAGSGQSAGTPTGTAAPATIALTHTPAAGAPLIVGPTLQDACAGTVYTTAPIADSPPASP